MSGGDVSLIDLRKVLMEANDRMVFLQPGKVQDGRRRGYVTVIVFQLQKGFTVIGVYDNADLVVVVVVVVVIEGQGSGILISGERGEGGALSCSSPSSHENSVGGR